VDLRCRHRKFGVLLKPSRDKGIVEFLCPSRWCGRKPGVVILHTFDTSTGKLVGTRAFKDPGKE